MEKRGREKEKRWVAPLCFEAIACRYLPPPPTAKSKAKSSFLLAKVIGPTTAHRRISRMLPSCLVLAAALLRIADAQLPATDLGTCQVRPFFDVLTLVYAWSGFLRCRVLNAP